MGKTNSLSRVLLLFALMVLNNAYETRANAAQPGVWGAGGYTYTLLYPEDSASFKKVQMLNESIYVQLYKGYAVVKGVYTFRNTTSKNLAFKMGYPVNGIYSGGQNELDQIYIDSLTQFKILAKGKRLPIVSAPYSTQQPHFDSFSQNWYVWEMSFLPDEQQQVEVYFIVSTNNASIRKGYDVESHNAFIYLLESGSVWKNPIEEGNFYIQLMEGLSLADIKGISEGFGVQYNATSKTFWGHKKQFTPTPKDNLVVTYWHRTEPFTFEAVLKQKARLYKTMDTFAEAPKPAGSFSTVEVNSPYEVNGTFALIYKSIKYFVLVSVFILIGAVLVFFVRRFSNHRHR